MGLGQGDLGSMDLGAGDPVRLSYIDVHVQVDGVEISSAMSIGVSGEETLTPNLDIFVNVPSPTVKESSQIDATQAEDLQQIWWSKTHTNTSTANEPVSLWKATGNPAAGTDPTQGLGGAVTTDKSTQGALFFHRAEGSLQRILQQLDCDPPNVTGTLLVCDRLAHAQITNNQATGNFSPILDATSRLSSGEGALLFMTVGATLAGAVDRTFTYTNQDGTGSRTTPTLSTVSGAEIGRSALADTLWVPMQAGDTGIRSIESTDLVSGSAGGSLDLALVRPLAKLSIEPRAVTSVNLTRGILINPKIDNNSCLFLVWIGDSIGTSDIFQGVMTFG